MNHVEKVSTVVMAKPFAATINLSGKTTLSAASSSPIPNIVEPTTQTEILDTETSYQRRHILQQQQQQNENDNHQQKPKRLKSEPPIDTRIERLRVTCAAQALMSMKKQPRDLLQTILLKPLKHHTIEHHPCTRDKMQHHEQTPPLLALQSTKTDPSIAAMMSSLTASLPTAPIQLLPTDTAAATAAALDAGATTSRKRKIKQTQQTARNNNNQHVLYHYPKHYHYHNCNALTTKMLAIRQPKQTAPITFDPSGFVFHVGHILLDFTRAMNSLMVCNAQTKSPYNINTYRMTVRLDIGNGYCTTKILHFNSALSKRFIMLELINFGYCSLNYNSNTTTLMSNQMQTLRECFVDKLVFPPQILGSIMFTDNHKTINVHLADDMDLYIIYTSLRNDALKTIELTTSYNFGSCTLATCCSRNDYRLVHPNLEIDLNYAIKEKIRFSRKNNLAAATTSSSSSTNNDLLSHYMICVVAKANQNWDEILVNFFHFSSKLTRNEIVEAIIQYGFMRMPKDATPTPIHSNTLKFDVEKRLELLDALVMRTPLDLVNIYITEQLCSDEHYYNNLAGFASFMYRDRPVYYID